MLFPQSQTTVRNGRAMTTNLCLPARTARTLWLPRKCCINPAERRFSGVCGVSMFRHKVLFSCGAGDTSGRTRCQTPVRIKASFPCRVKCSGLLCLPTLSPTRCCLHDKPVIAAARGLFHSSMLSTYLSLSAARSLAFTENPDKDADSYFSNAWEWKTCLQTKSHNEIWNVALRRRLNLYFYNSSVFFVCFF